MDEFEREVRCLREVFERENKMFLLEMEVMSDHLFEQSKEAHKRAQASSERLEALMAREKDIFQD